MSAALLRAGACGGGIVLAALCVDPSAAAAPTPQQDGRRSVDAQSAPASPQRQLLDRYCVTCHNARQETAGLTLDRVDVQEVGEHAEIWEKVVRKLRARAMPPVGRPRPDDDAYEQLTAWLETELDRSARLAPNPGRKVALHRLNRTEYQHAIRDLLGVEGIDMGLLLPADDSSRGFDNIGGALKLSSTLFERYLSAARKISRIAVAARGFPVDVATYRIKEDLPQWDRFDELPLGTRGGKLIRHYFPVNGEYVFRANVDGTVGIDRSHHLELAVDGERVEVVEFTGDGRTRYGQFLEESTETVEMRVAVKAGLRNVAATFLKITSAEQPGVVQEYPRPFAWRPPMPILSSVTVIGPFEPIAAGDSPSRAKIFTCYPSEPTDEAPCARRIVARLARTAYRRPVPTAEVDALLSFYEAGRREGGFDEAIGRALERLLVSPSFLFRIERDPENVAPGSPYRVSDLELASRLSFFLWSSIPDDELLTVAARGALHEPAELERQVRRMLGSPKAEALVRNFVGQWLELRVLDASRPNEVIFPNFDDNLRQSLRRETELFFQTILREDRSALDLLNGDFTFVNERLARHYGIPNVYGSHFRRVGVSDESRRGLLGHASVLTVTSYSTRTSPVVRGKWILDNFLGAPPPPPPPNVPTLAEKSDTGEALSMREAMERHRANPACASCHAQMDPLGFSLENFDAVGRWRTHSEANEPIDASGALPGGATFDGVEGLRDMLLSRPEDFVSTLTEKLMTYALGRGVEYYDMPAIRQIIREAAPEGYSLSSLVTGIVTSVPFQMRRAGS